MTSLLSDLNSLFILFYLAPRKLNFPQIAFIAHDLPSSYLLVHLIVRQFFTRIRSNFLLKSIPKQLARFCPLGLAYIFAWLRIVLSYPRFLIYFRRVTFSYSCRAKLVWHQLGCLGQARVRIAAQKIWTFSLSISKMNARTSFPWLKNPWL